MKVNTHIHSRRIPAPSMFCSISPFWRWIIQLCAICVHFFRHFSNPFSSSCSGIHSENDLRKKIKRNALNQKHLTKWNELALYKCFVYLCALVQSFVGCVCVCVWVCEQVCAWCESTLRICLHLLCNRETMETEPSQKRGKIKTENSRHTQKQTNKQSTVHCRIQAYTNEFHFSIHANDSEKKKNKNCSSPSQWVELAAHTIHTAEQKRVKQRKKIGFIWRWC